MKWKMGIFHHEVGRIRHIDWLFDWLIDRSMDWLTEWLIDWLIDWLIPVTSSPLFSLLFFQLHALPPHPFETVMAREARRVIDGSKVVVLCHRNPVPANGLKEYQNAVWKLNMRLWPDFNNRVLKFAVEGGRYAAVIPFLQVGVLHLYFSLSSELLINQINQSINQSTTHAMKKQANQSINQSLYSNWSINQSIKNTYNYRTYARKRLPDAITFLRGQD